MDEPVCQTCVQYRSVCECGEDTPDFEGPTEITPRKFEPVDSRGGSRANPREYPRTNLGQGVSDLTPGQSDTICPLTPDNIRDYMASFRRNGLDRLYMDSFLRSPINLVEETRSDIREDLGLGFEIVDHQPANWDPGIVEQAVWNSAVSPIRREDINEAFRELDNWEEVPPSPTRKELEAKVQHLEKVLQEAYQHGLAFGPRESLRILAKEIEDG